jgi:hypothetical protein
MPSIVGDCGAAYEPGDLNIKWAHDQARALMKAKGVRAVLRFEDDLHWLAFQGALEDARADQLKAQMLISEFDRWSILAS